MFYRIPRSNENTKWVKKSRRSQKTNIDVVVYQHIWSDSIQVEYGKYDGKLSDHVPIHIELK